MTCTTTASPLLFADHLHAGLFVAAGFDSTGTALQDGAAAVLVYRRAADADAGLRVVLNDRPVGEAAGQAQ